MTRSASRRGGKKLTILADVVGGDEEECAVCGVGMDPKSKVLLFWLPLWACDLFLTALDPLAALLTVDLTRLCCIEYTRHLAIGM